MEDPIKLGGVCTCRLLARTWFALAILQYLAFSAHGQTTYLFRESSNPSGLISPFETQVQAGNVQRVRNIAVVSGTHRFAFWTINGVRQAFPNGQAFLYPEVTVNAPVEAVAHFFPVTEDGDGDRLPDWWEYWMFGDRSRGPQEDDDGDGRTHEEEYRNGYSARFRDDLQDGGLASRLSAPLRLIVRDRLRYTLRSEPLGLISAEGELAPGGSYTTPNLRGDISGFTFIGFEIDGQPARDVTGHCLNRVTVTPTADTAIVARYIPAGSDTDADGIPDALEWQNFGSLAQAPESDPDGDGFTIAEERRLGLGLIAPDRVLDGGIASRLSSPLEFDRVRSRYTVQSRPLGLISSTSEMIQNGTERTSPHLGTGLVSGHAFGYWTLNGQRLAAPDGIARRQVKVAVNGATELVAHFFLPDQDSDADTLPDWWEWNSFGSLDYSTQGDPDGDGFAISEERRLGLGVATRDVLVDGGIAARLSAPLSYESGSRKRLTIRSSPRGIVTDEERRLATDTEFVSNHYSFTQPYSGYHFTHWTRNGARVTDPAGHSRNRLVFNLAEDTELVAHFVLPTEDLDADGIPDHLELRLAANLATLDLDSDPDGDDLTFADERRMGLSALSRDVIQDGGIATRLSAPATLQFSVPPLTLRPDRLRIANGSPSGSLVGALSLFPAISGRTYQFALELGTGGDHNAQFAISGNELRLASTLDGPEKILWLRIRATDDQGTVRTFQTTVAVGDPGSDEDASFESWITQWPSLEFSTPEADPDGDGFSNLLEFVLGGDPSQMNFEISPSARRLNGNLIFTFQRSEASKSSNLDLAVEVSNDLISWPLRYLINPDTSAPEISIEENGSDPDIITVTIPGTADNLFARLKVGFKP